MVLTASPSRQSEPAVTVSPLNAKNWKNAPGNSTERNYFALFVDPCVEENFSRILRFKLRGQYL